ncbi:hypothetical protein AFIC_000917 [[Pseudomonas] carboxydohydrogena]|uniref:Uncharacterized protein n=1 Tax=Afipia carboxydohydrogena TaxID=290 RepID=A0ABY8BTZ0_AFICR|nr:hypothetical protein AFIC_000917 [[Pseudomonas] carboxydohydrogena]
MCRGVAKHEPVPRRSSNRLIHHELDKGFTARRHRIVAQQHHSRTNLGRGVMQPHRHPLGDRPRFRGKYLQFRIDPVGRRMQHGIEHHVAATDRILADLIARKIERAAIPCLPVLRGAILHMDGPHTRHPPRRTDNDLISYRNAAGEHGSRHHGARTGQCERTIDREAETSLRRAAGPCRRRREKMRAQFRDACPGRAGHREHRRIVQRRWRQQIRDLDLNLGEALGVHHIRLCNRDRAGVDAEQIDDRQMFDGLRHDAVIGGNHQQREIDSGRTGEHVVNEAFVPRHVDKTKNAAPRHRQIGKTEIDRYAARLLFFQAIGIDARQRPHQRGLAMIDMPCGADNHHADSGNGRSASFLARSISATDNAANVG